jgi:hypothetical protein
VRKRIPKFIDFPFGYEVEVRQLSRKDFVEECGTECYACWESGDSGGVIYLDKSRPIKKRRADLAHEVLHAAADFEARLLGTEFAEAKG